jgi:hypothetical protein
VSEAHLASINTHFSRSTDQPPNITSLLMGILAHPRATFKSLRDAAQGYWWLIFMITVIALTTSVLVSANIPAQSFASSVGMAAADANMNMPSDLPQASQSSSAMALAVLLVSGIAVILLGYAARGLVVFAASLVMGGHATFKQTLRMAIWTTIPAIFRHMVNSVAMAATSGQIVAGISGVLTTMEARSLPFLNTLLSQVDFYAIWSMVLLGIGVTVTTRLGKGKSVVVVLIYIITAAAGLLIFYFAGNALSGLLGGVQQSPSMMGPRG